jgi:hypothetical protein
MEAVMVRNASGTALISGSIFLALVSQVDARSCATLGLDPAGVQDGQLLNLSAANGWQTFSTLQSITAGRPQSLMFAYVIKDQPTPGRKGVLVIKSGRSEVSSDQHPNMVHLVRNEFAARFKNTCEAMRHGNQRNAYFPIAGRRIPSRSYDDYHDYKGRQPPEIDVLQAFHIAYEGPGGCHETDETSSDDANPNNRSQFSFSPDRVRSGQYIGLVSLFSTASAATSSDGLADQRTEIRRYETSVDGTACVTFQIPMSGANYFVRVNDLDVRLPPFSLRRPEGSW